MTAVIWIYYVVLLGPTGSHQLNVREFDSIEACEAHMRKNHKLLQRSYSRDGDLRLTGSGCRRKPA